MIDFDDVNDDYSNARKGSPKAAPTPASTARSAAPKTSSYDDIDLGVTIPSPVLAHQAAPSVPPVSATTSLPDPVAPVPEPVEESVPVAPSVMPVPEDPTTEPVAAETAMPVAPETVVPPAVAEPLVATEDSPVEPSVVASSGPLDQAAINARVDALLASGDAWLRLTGGSPEAQQLAQDLSRGWQDLNDAIVLNRAPQDVDFLTHETHLWGHLGTNDWNAAYQLAQSTVLPGPVIGSTPERNVRIEKMEFARGIKLVTHIAMTEPMLLPTLAAGEDVDVFAADPSSHLPSPFVPMTVPMDPPLVLPEATTDVQDVPTPVPTASVPAAARNDRPSQPSSATDDQEDEGVLLAKPSTNRPVVPGLDLKVVAGAGALIAVLIAAGGWFLMRKNAPEPPAPTVVAAPAAVVPTASSTVVVSTPKPVVSVPAAPVAPPSPVASVPTVAPAPPAPVVVAPAAPASTTTVAPATVVPSSVTTPQAPRPGPAPAPAIEAAPSHRTVTNEARTPKVDPKAREQARMDAINAELDRKLKAMQNQ